MEAELLRFPHKRIRAHVIKQYIQGRYKKVICFSCGNAAAELEAAGVDTLHIGDKGVLTPRQWFTQAEIADIWPGYFDATSGHLPIELMSILGSAYKAYLTQVMRLELPDLVYVPCGSGETLVCLKLAYPNKKFVAVYNLDKATEYSPRCPLNDLVKLLAEARIFHEGDIIKDGGDDHGKSGQEEEGL